MRTIYIVGECGIDYKQIKHVCCSFSTARKRWREIRKSLIKQAREMIAHDKKEGMEWNIPTWQTEIDELIKMKPGGSENVSCDHPFLMQMEIEK